MPPLLRTNYSKRRLPPEQLKEQIQDLVRILSPDVAGQFHKLVEVYRSLRTMTARDAHYLILNEWKKHEDEAKLSHFMTEKIPELRERLEQQEKNRLRVLNTHTGSEYRRLATQYLQSKFTPEALGRILNSKARQNELGSVLFKKCDADILAKCPEVFESMKEVQAWRKDRNRQHCIKSLILRALPDNLRQNLSPHSAGESALESLIRAAAFAADTHDAQSGEPEPQDACGSNFGYHDMAGAAEGTDVGWDGGRGGHCTAAAALDTEGDLPSLLLGLTHLTASELAGGRQGGLCRGLQNSR